MPTTTSTGRLHPGCSTASSLNVNYRVGRISSHLSGTWLDYGCADGGYSAALLANGASSVVGVDVEADRIEAAQARCIPNATFHAFDGFKVNLPDEIVDGAFVNEVMEHVDNEQTSLKDIYRLMKPGGTLIIISPNRWFPFEGHGSKIAGKNFGPTPLIPWLPLWMTDPWTHARNYWPHQLSGLARGAGFDICEVGYIWPVFEFYSWLPRSVIALYQHWLTRIDNLPVIRRFGVSTLVIAKKPVK